MEDKNCTANSTCILVVASQEDVRKILQEAMIMAGYQCVIASNGLEALDRLSENHIDMVITDVKMPLMGGLELTTQIRNRYDANVIVMAGFTENYTFEEIITKGASELILNPVSIPELYMRIRLVLRETTLLRERNLAMKKLQDSEQRYQEMSITDSLTKLFNSRQFYSILHTEIERSSR
jgi:PleD family two-component response regulator